MILAVAVALACAYLVCNNQPGFTGDRVRNQESYLLDCRRMNGNDSHSLYLEEGEVLRVSSTIKSGSMRVTIGIDGEDAIYKSDSIEAGSFDVIAPKTGSYKIQVDAKHFAGKISFNIE